VSNTITVDNWEAVTDYVYGQRAYFAGISFIPLTGDKIYNQAPFTAVLLENDLVRTYGPASIFASGLIVEALKLFPNLWEAVSAVENGFEQGEKDEHTANLRNEWIRRFRNFANNYFHGDTATTGYCLKDVYLFHKWKKIEQNLAEIDWEKEMVVKPEKEIEVSSLAALACSGPNGVCEITF
jgi:ribonucleoside-diphosphate reductase alpha chain